MSVPIFFQSDGVAVSTFDILVNGVSVTTKAMRLSWSNALNTRDTLQVTFREHYLKPAPADDGSRIEVIDNNVTVFGGIITAPAIQQDGESEFLLYECTAEDYSAIPQRRLVAAIYENATVAAIIADINAQFLSGEGLSLGQVETGPTIVKAVFNYTYADQAFNELAELSGMTWWIDYAKVLHFKSRASVVASSAIDSTGYLNFRVQKTRQDYRNAETVRAGTDLTDPRVESFIGDGTRRVFNLAFQVGTVPTIAVNGVGKTVGILGVETEKDWYWNKGKTEIAQSDSGANLADTDTLSVTYQGLVPIVVSAEDDSEIAARAATESGSGRYEHVEDRPNIDNGDMAIQTASQLLARHGRITRVIDVTTRTPGYRAGQLVTIANTRHQINGQFLIESVSASEFMEPDSSGAPQLAYTLRALEGDFQGGWVAFFHKLAEIGRAFVIRENEILMLQRRRVEEVYCHDTVATRTGAPVTARVDAALVGFSEVAA